MSKYKILPLFISFQGCPQQCVYCNQNEITGSSGMTPDLAGQEIKKASQEMTDFQVAFYGGSFTALDRDLQFAYFNQVQAYLGKEVNSIRLSTRPDAIDQDHIGDLKSMGLRTIELGAQSMDPKVLDQSLRGHSDQDVVEAVEVIKSLDLELGIQQMLGLPAENWESFKDSVDKICRLKPDFVRIYPTLVLKETPLARLYENKSYTPLSLEEALEWASYAYRRYRKEGIDVIRIGLQATDRINFQGDLLAGPFHPSLGQMVKSRALVDQISSFLARREIHRLEEILASKRMVANIVGLKAWGRKNLEEDFGPIQFTKQEEKRIILRTEDQEIDLGDEENVFKIY